MDSLGTRLRIARETAGFKSARSAALKFGWTPSTYAAHENGQNEFGPDAAKIYAKAFRTTGAWLLTGEGDAPKAKRGAALVSSYDPDAPPEPEIGGEEEPSETPRPVDFPQDAIKELAVKAGMGTGQTITTTYVRDGKEIKQTDPILDDYWRLPPHFVRSNLGARIADLLIVECIGDSMEPTLRAGDRVIANTAHRKPSPDGLYAIRDSLGEIVVKRLEIFGKDPIRVRVISDNPLHGPKEWDLDEMEIVGKVVAGLKLF